MMQCLKLFSKRIILSLSHERSVNRLRTPVLCFHERTATIVTELFSVFIKISSIAFRNICSNGISSLNKLSTYSFLWKVFLFINNIPDVLANGKSKLVYFEVFKFQATHKEMIGLKFTQNNHNNSMPQYLNIRIS